MPTLADDRLARAHLSLDGLSTGDAFGQCFFSHEQFVTPERIARDDIPPRPWVCTDDTEMAKAIIEVLARHGRIEQDELAKVFAERYMAAPHRGYGGGAKALLTAIYAGRPWREAASALFQGGSMGNGAAMRIAPLGAYFADDVPLMIEEARRSAAVTHAHPEGINGAIAVAAAAAFAANHAGQHTPLVVGEFMEFVLAHTPAGQTRHGIRQAMDMPRTRHVREAVGVLGNGSRTMCPDTVPFCIWMAARHFDDYRVAVWTTAACGGDIDTTCAIVGGIVALSSGSPVPATWLEARGRI